jgi:hypothetical protein
VQHRGGTGAGSKGGVSWGARCCEVGEESLPIHNTAAMFGRMSCYARWSYVRRLVQVLTAVQVQYIAVQATSTRGSTVLRRCD